jgi:hypothetical protein
MGRFLITAGKGPFSHISRERSITMEQRTVVRQLVWTAAMLAAAVILAGCEASPPQPPGKQPTEDALSPEEAREQQERAPGAEPRPEPPPAVAPEGEPQTPRAKAEPAAESKRGAEPEGEPSAEPRLESGREPAAEREPKSPPAAEPEPQAEPTPETQPGGPEAEPPALDARKTPDLGPPLVKDPRSLIRLDKTRPLWIDKANKRVVMVGQICQRDAPLELFACLRNTKEHEAIVSVDVEAATVHAGLLAVGAKAGHPVRWDPKYVPATGSEIEVTVVWKDKDGKPQTARAQDWVLDTRTKQAMTFPWVFAGSGFWQDGESGQKYYQAEGGDFICVSNFPSAMLDLPIESSESNEALLFRAYTERIPPLGTPVTLLLGPKLEKEKKPPQKEAEKGAGAVAEKNQPAEEPPAKPVEAAGTSGRSAGLK